MLSEHDKSAILALCQRYGVKRMLLFGSSTDPTQVGRDLDLAVEGIEPAKFFSLYGDLIFAVSKPMDLVDLSKRSRFTDIIRREGIPLYVAST